ncbi:hypothetical protein [uncultured Thiodictyon sp.]|jgi:hypothetical protein|uniref:hypothetical protein n=1 Tax=uncultured Thiodictyon sp. TaxID=1846217 RepID=UPI0025E46A38|nr:hypothetical protein [uncultured Thiodictyon sp.]
MNRRQVLQAAASWKTAASITGWTPESFRSRRDDPAGIDGWIETHLRPSSCTMLVVDARDPGARAQTSAWAERLGGLEEPGLRTALVLGDAAPDPGAPWRAALHTRLDGVCDISPQRARLRAAALAIYIDALLMLTPTLIGYDALDVRRVLKSGATLRTGATLWGRKSRRAQAFCGLWAELTPDRLSGALVWLHGGADLSMDDLDWLHDEIGERLPETAIAVPVLFPHSGWPAGRQVLGRVFNIPPISQTNIMQFSCLIPNR